MLNIFCVGRISVSSALSAMERKTSIWNIGKTNRRLDSNNYAIYDKSTGNDAKYLQIYQSCLLPVKATGVLPKFNKRSK